MYIYIYIYIYIYAYIYVYTYIFIFIYIYTYTYIYIYIYIYMGSHTVEYTRLSDTLHPFVGAGVGTEQGKGGQQMMLIHHTRNTQSKQWDATWDTALQGPVLQCVAACCSVLQRVAMCCNVLQCVTQCVISGTPLGTPHCKMLQCVAVCCSVLQFVALCCNILAVEHRIARSCVAVRCSAVQCFNSGTPRETPPCKILCLSVFQRAAVCCSASTVGRHLSHCIARSCVAVRCIVLQSFTVCCSMLQCVSVS